MERRRDDLIGQTGSITRTIKIVDAKESEHGVAVRISDSMGNVYWTDLDEDISLD
ncbi:hypothetical protein [Paenibacillus alvei]|uniref:hypothetical protein n=1 Tax=Paenibacillus alvei TaxID=44250 RepID=UPI0013DB3EFB|nr:hypothetical protein [Paenibacillus alvei]